MTNPAHATGQPATTPGQDGAGPATGGSPAHPPAAPPASQDYQSLHYTASKPPKLVVDVATCNVRKWETSLKRYARARKLLPAYTGDPTGVPQGKYEDMTTELEGIIDESVPDTAYDAGLGEEVTDLPPHQAIAAIKDFCSKLITPAMKEMLRQEAEEIKIERDESIDDYIQRHNEHRRKMVKLEVSGSSEPEYVLTILRGLESRPSLSSQIAWLQGMNFQSVFALHMQLKQTVPTQDRLWKSGRRARGRRGGRGRGRGGRGG